ncbi:hypothetical protein [Actinoplanes awajinensis]|uniref:Uncharacterized protein n=1 Tax=Actinoplanes awajinensis subsp. mycoplanecinus TaxID=135947 RepID=A0A117MM65_9ACTN|nr:hypothetical protein [Actinoplanes awajinensis]KUL25032.1 hypothetical protein ADL15_42995 [Actinoplanes awajinensis subsp. mycoplanecinus]
MSDIDPYAEQTATNTQADWLGGGPPLKVDLQGLRAYAKHMADQQLDLGARGAHLSRLISMPNDAWTGDVLGEATAAKSMLTANGSEFLVYLGQLGKTLHNVGMAAQTVADSYEANDAMSAASLNDVLFAFGDKSVPRPDGLPSSIGKTYAEQLSEQKGKPLSAGSELWTDDGEAKQLGPNQTLQTATGPNGERREMVTVTVPGNGTVVSTTVYNAKGHVVASGSTHTVVSFDSRTDTQTTTTRSFDAKGKPTGGSVETTSYTSGGEVRHQVEDTLNAKGAVTNRKITDLDPGDQVVTETSEKSVRDDKGHGTHLEETDRLTIGTQTEGQPGVVEPIAVRYDPYYDEVTD